MENNLFDLQIELVKHNKKNCQKDYIILSNDYPDSKHVHIGVEYFVEMLSNIDIALNLSKEQGDLSIVEPLLDEYYYYSYSDSLTFKELREFTLKEDSVIFSQTPIKYIEITNFFSIGIEDDYSIYFKNLNISVTDMIRLKEFLLKQLKTHPYFKKKKNKKTF